MQLREADKLWVTLKRDGRIFSSLSGRWIEETEQDKIKLAKDALSVFKNKYMTEKAKNEAYDLLISKYKALMPSEEEIRQQEEELKNRKEVAAEVLRFFKDFEFEPSFRFVNTMYWHSEKLADEIAYVYNYFNLSDSQYKDDVKEKMKSYEFKQMIAKMNTIKTTNHTNARLKIYYGSAGTGKTTTAMKEANNNVVVCNSAMLPTDLLEDFAFDNGKAGFHKSALWTAMEEGKKIVLDEINLLPFESIRFLQGITDNKQSIIYKGQTINIKDGFQIIGTMNLRLGGSCYGLPEPLLDRASELKEYKLTEEQLANAF